MAIVVVMLFSFSRFIFHIFNMTPVYIHPFNIASLFNILALIFTAFSPFYSFIWYEKHTFPYAMIATGICISIIFVNVIVYLVKSKLYRQSLPRNISIIILFIIIYSYIEKIMLITTGTSMYLGSSFIIGFSVLILSNIIASKFNREYRELVELKNGLELKVEERTRQIREANEQRTNYFINLAHETKTPLTIIKNYLESYIKEAGNDPKLEIIENSINKLTSDMINFLDVQKIEKGIPVYDHESTTDFSDTLKEKLSLFETTAALDNISLKSRIMDGILVKADPYAIDRIINNLVSNAIKFTSEGGEVEVSLSMNDELITFIVRDTGIGIENEELDNIFKPYHQISRNKANIQGIGMGLYITKKIIESLNGRIDVQSTLNEGSVFSVYLRTGGKPSKKSAVHVETKKLSAGGAPNADKKIKDSVYDKIKKSILIVEDNRELLSYLRDELDGEYNVYLAMNGLQAVNKLASITEPDLIISDIMMDEMDGHTFLNKISSEEKFQGIPFIFLTAIRQDKEKLQGLGEGAVDYIVKPFSTVELKAKIRTILDYSEKRRTKDLKKVTKIIQDELLGKTANAGDKLTGRLNEYQLTGRQIEIINLIKEGLEYKEIAQNLGISLKTVKKHVELLFKKLKVKNKIELLNKILN